MTLVPSCESARRHLNAAKADALLATMNAMEELAEVAEGEVIPSVRERLGATYERLIGVEPASRAELRARLELIARNGHHAVEDIVAGFR